MLNMVKPQGIPGSKAKYFSIVTAEVRNHYINCISFVVIFSNGF